MRKFVLAALAFVAVVLGLVAAVQAGDKVVSRYDVAGVVNTVSTSSGDPADIGSTTTANGRTFKTNGCPNVTVGGGFSTSAANAVVWLVRGTLNDQTGTFQPSPIATQFTLTADAASQVNGLYVAPASKQDTAGFNACYLVVKSVSAGTVTLSVAAH